MSRLIWCTDVHLDFLSENLIDEFIDKLAMIPDVMGYVFSGDIATSTNVRYVLSRMDHVLWHPVYFVLGNHDYYGSSIKNMRNSMVNLTHASRNLRYLTTLKDPCWVTPKVAIVGHDCWYDAKFGNPRSGFILNDWRFIGEFIYARSCNHSDEISEIIKLSIQLADQGVEHIQRSAIKAIEMGASKIIIVSHPVPFQEVHFHRGQLGDENAAPWYVCKSLGEMLLDLHQQYPNVEFLSLAGHTHGECELSIDKNLKVMVGGSTYGNPDVSGVIMI